MTAMLSAALRYVELGYAVFPCAPGTKAPLTVHGYQDASREPEQIEHWWTERPNANIGLATAGLLVLDIDTAENTWLQDDLDKRLELADAPLSLTPHGGRQCVFRQPAGRAWRNTAGDLAPRVDTRADGGYILAPPSALEDGAYRWAQGVELDVGPDSLPEPPAWLIAQLDAIAARRESSPASGDAAENVIPDGQRNNTLARLAGAMRRVGMSQAELLAALRVTNRDRCRPPLADDEVERIAASVARYAPDLVSVALVEDHWTQQFSQPGAERFRFAAITSAELAAGNYTLTYLVENLLVRGQPGVIAGPKKSLKTNVSIDLALALSQAGLFLGRFNVPQAVRVGVMSAESGAATIQETARRIGAAHDMPLEDFTNVVWSFDVPQLRNAVHIDALGAFVSDYALDVLILDPTYLMMLGLGNDAGNLFIVGELLKSLGELAQRTGCTPLLCHHLKKSVAEPYEPAELENIAWAGFQEFVRQWILLNRRVRYDPDQGGHHELWMSVGGSAGHSGLWGLDIEEGTPQDPGGRRWEIEVLSAHEAYAERSEAAQDAAEQRKQRQHESRRERQRNAVWEALRLFPDGETPRVIRETAGVSGAVVTEQLATLVQKGLAEQCTIKKHTREEPAFRPLQGGGTGGTVPARPSTG